MGLESNVWPIRFSLRSFLLFAAIVAVVCTWCVLPSIAARRFISRIAENDFPAADAMFRNSNDRCLEKWDVEHWSFQATGRLAPWTLGQLFRGRRQVEFNMSYFALDQVVNRDGQIVVTPFGAQKLEIGPERFGSMIIDGRPDTVRTFKK